MRAPLRRSLVLAAALGAAAVPFASTARAGIADVVAPCDGAGATDYMSYCCKKPRTVPLLFLVDPAGSGYDQLFLSRTKEILGAHSIDVNVISAGEGIMGQQRTAQNTPELCEIVLDALAGAIDKIKYRLPVVFATYNSNPDADIDSFGKHIENLRTTCEPAFREWYSDDPARLERQLNRLDDYEVVVINTYQLDKGMCGETLAHEIGHSSGLGHEGEASNVMSSCARGVAHDGLTHHQVAKLCEPKRFNRLFTLP
jgi:hypothetical protein